jgi:hypothetical protein
MKINSIERDLIKKLTYVHLKRCNVVSKEKLNLTLSLEFIQAYSPLIKEGIFEKIINFVGKNQNIIKIIDTNCKTSSLYRQPVIYLLLYLKMNYRNDFFKYWNFTEEELNRINNDLKNIRLNA